MPISKLTFLLVCLMSVTLQTQEAKVTPLFSKDLTDFPGKEGVMKLLLGGRALHFWWCRSAIVARRSAVLLPFSSWP